MIDADLISCAETHGMVLLPCSCCDGAGYTSPERGGWDHCYACNGTGNDRTDGGLFLAMTRTGVQVTPIFAHDRTLGVSDFRDPAKTAWAPHDGTPGSIATAALTAFCQVRTP